MSAPRKWEKGAVAPLDATPLEWALHYALWGELLVEVPTCGEDGQPLQRDASLPPLTSFVHVTSGRRSTSQEGGAEDDGGPPTPVP